MNINKIINLKNYKNDKEMYNEMIKADYNFNASFRGTMKLSRSFLNSYEWRIIKCYRKYQANHENILGDIYGLCLHHLENKTGISFEKNISIGKGLIIGHWGKIVINGNVEFGEQLFLTHGVTIGRDVRGKRSGVPKFGNRVCIRTNSTVVGNITIGDDVLIAPNTFVNFDVPSHSIVIGNPASIHSKEGATVGHLGELL